MSDIKPKSPPVSTEETIISNIIIEELPDNFILDKKKQNVIVDYEILSKSSEGNASDYNSEDESQNDRKKRTADDDLAEVATPPHVNSEGGLIIKEIYDFEIIEKEKVECAAIIEEEESYQDVNKKENAYKFTKNKKRKTNDKRNEPTVS
ncbi:hypothetical protein RclHR1_06120002 [Rhizophagus clarus]|uniref:Uncharacterized protein n=1 Tax=Rhizophagus clarus TaxID=94130 RepID=A0A2Z6RQA8_9GLOM|nr:hypothetical protein RclHR1_06120002 [Rhizophagus clarus]GES79795.1 hypothetical protein GLOIN_2v1495968 [Rhizophagus clarus]